MAAKRTSKPLAVLAKLGESHDVDLDELRQQFIKSFGGEQGIAESAHALYSAHDTSPQTKARLMELVLGLMVKTGSSGSDRISTASDEELDAVLDEVIDEPESGLDDE